MLVPSRWSSAVAWSRRLCPTAELGWWSAPNGSAELTMGSPALRAGAGEQARGATMVPMRSLPARLLTAATVLTAVLVGLTGCTSTTYSCSNGSCSITDRKSVVEGKREVRGGRRKVGRRREERKK